MAIINRAIMAILIIKSIMAIIASVLKDPKYEFFGCLVKEWSKCRSPVKTVLKMMFRVKSYNQNKKNGPFLGQFLYKIGRILKLMALSNESL